LNEYDNEKKFFRAISTEKITILVLTNERGYLNYEIEGEKIKIYLKIQDYVDTIKRGLRKAPIYIQKNISKNKNFEPKFIKDDEINDSRYVWQFY
jgi:hypothetical protein